MKILHTSDWHVGKVLKGQSRVDEQLAVLAEIVSIAEAERPDLVIMAGDLYDTATPTADTKKIVIRALTALRRHAAAVVADASATYADHVARLFAVLTESFGDGSKTVNLAAGHLTVFGGKLGGGEREAHTIEAYAVPSTIFPASTHYVALGHLHRRQQIPGPCPVHYCGSPFAVDFGEEENSPSVSIVEVTADTAAKVREVPITSAVPLRTVRGTLPELALMDVDPRAWLRVYVREKPRAGLKEDVQELLPQALEVRIDPRALPELDTTAPAAPRAGRSPTDLFAEYLNAKGVGDDALAGLFNRLHDEVTTP
jgi:exonuclease SbcD